MFTHAKTRMGLLLSLVSSAHGVAADHAILKTGFRISAAGRTGTYRVRIKLTSAGGVVLATNAKVTTFKVRR